MTPFKKIFSFLASLKLAVSLLAIVCLCLIVGTVIESRWGTIYAQALVYQSLLFFGLDFFLFLNVLCSALKRLPFQKKYLGFYTIHLGILVLLLGAGITAVLGTNGTMTLEPNKKTSWMELDRTVLEVTGSPLLGCSVGSTVDLPQTVFAKTWSENKFLFFDHYTVFLKRFLPLGVPQHGFERAVLLSVVDEKNAGDPQTFWVTDTAPICLDVEAFTGSACPQNEMCFFLKNKTWSLPFSVTLKNFEMTMEQTTNQPASYKSTVTVQKNGAEETARISMNQPLKKDGYTFYQSSYFPMEDSNKYGSALAVNKDPGRLWKYFGSLLLTLGCLIHFTRRSSIRVPS